jgi:hypothetical protein
MKLARRLKLKRDEIGNEDWSWRRRWARELKVEDGASTM